MPEQKHDPFYIVDGSGYIFRAYYAVRPLSTSSGLPTNALLGFTKMLLKLLADVQATHIAVAFDRPEPTFRHEMYDQYKANRAECPEDLVPQMPYFRRIVEALGVASLDKPGFEADDIIATLAVKFSAADRPVVVVSGDKDLAQLVNDQITVWDAMRDIRFDPRTVHEKFGVYPAQIVDLLALAGDSSDNVPGASGVGPKTAVRLIEHFGSLQQLLQSPEKIEEIQGLRGAAGVRTRIESALDAIRLSQRLVRLDTAVEPFVSVKSVDAFAWKEPQRELLLPLADELEFHKLFDSIDGVSLTRSTPALEQHKQYQLLDEETFPTFVEHLAECESFAFDTETTGLDVFTCDLVGISISWEDHQSYFIPVGVTSKPEVNLDRELVRSALGPIFANPNVAKVGVNLKFDARVLEEQGYRVEGLAFDAMLASYVINPDRRQHGLKALTKHLLDETMLPFREVLGSAEHIGEIDVDSLVRYACHDADASWRLRAPLEERLGPRSACSSRSAFEDIEMPLVPVLASMERVGIALDAAFLSSFSDQLTAELSELEAEIYRSSGETFNINSPKQMGEILFDRLSLPTKGVKKTKSGYSTDASVLQKLREVHPVIPAVLEYRELHKLKSTYVDALQRLQNPKTGRVHTSFNQAIAATGRLSSSDPNLQNIPIRTERGKLLRNAFVAAPGQVLIAADYSQIELRVLAHLSEDKNLSAAFQRGDDIHLATAKQIFGEFALAGDDAQKLRRAAKTINFGVVYGMSAFRLADQLGVSRTQAQQYIDGYFEQFPRVREYFAGLQERAKVDGYVETLFGHRRYLADIDSQGRDPGYVMRSLMNAPVQGTAAEIIKIAMIRLHNRLSSFDGEARLVLQVHDELIVEAREEILDSVRQVVVDEMESATALCVPLTVDCAVGASWGAAA